MTDQTPDFMPILGVGPHDEPSQGACIMEYASFLAGDEWTDRPRCTNLILTLVAQAVNDSRSDDERQGLLPLLPRLMNTSIISKKVEDGLLAFLIANAIPQSYFGAYFKDFGVDYLRKCPYGDRPFACGEGEVCEHAVDNLVCSLPDTVEFLTEVLDEFDRLTGRTPEDYTKITPEDLAACAALTRGAA